MRQPEYTKDRKYRIVSVPNGLWRLQQDTGQKGMNACKASKGVEAREHSDPWINCGRATDYLVAKWMLNSRQPVEPKAGVA